MLVELNFYLFILILHISQSNRQFEYNLYV